MGTALARQLVHLLTLRGLRHGGGPEARLLMADLALVAGMVLTVPATLNLVAAKFAQKDHVQTKNAITHFILH